MTPTTQTPVPRADTPESLERPVLNRGAPTPFVPSPRVGTTPAGTVERHRDSAPVPAGGHRKCQVPGCNAGLVSVTYQLFRGEPLRHLLLDCDSCDGTGLDLASYAAGGTTGPGRPAAPLAHQPGGTP